MIYQEIWWRGEATNENENDRIAELSWNLSKDISTRLKQRECKESISEGMGK